MGRPKVEIYKLSITDKSKEEVTFRTYFRDRYNLHESPSKKIKDFFNPYFEEFTKAFGNDGYLVDDKKLKGLKLRIEKKGEKFETIIFNKPTDNIVYGQVDGGKHGRRRSVGDLKDIDKNDILERNKIVCDKYYFLIYTPLDSKYGYVLVQADTELYISDILRKELKKFFRIRRKFKCNIEKHIPESLRQEYLESTTVESMKFSADWIAQPGFKKEKQKAYELQVNIEIIDKSESKNKFQKLKAFGDLFNDAFLTLGNGKLNQKKLESFKKTAKVKKDKTALTVQFDEERRAIPVIYLDEYDIYPDSNTGEVDFEIMHAFCLDMLVKIIEDQNSPSDAITEV
jgi:hypothetical protein